MKLKFNSAVMMVLICLLSGCQTTGSTPNLQDLQPTQQEQNQAKITGVMQS